MLSRSAQGVYWMGRYLMRAQYLSQLLELHVQALVDRSVEEIHFGWRRVYRSMKRFAPAGEEWLEEAEDFALNGRIPTRSGAAWSEGARTPVRCATASAPRCGRV